MKKWLRKWLDIEEHKPTDEIGLRRVVGQAIEDALDGKSDVDWWNSSPNIIASKLTWALERAAAKTVPSKTRKEVSAIIDNEDFIDKVVARIKRKQLS